MKILLYEPDKGGHHDVILSYVEEIVASGGGSPEILREDYSNRADELGALREEAARRGCELIHVLTTDGRGRKWLKALFRSPNTGREIPVIGTYYLYSNLEGTLSGLAWDLLFVTARVGRLLVSDESLSQRVPAWRRRHLGYLCDPWKESELPRIKKKEACESLGLAAGKIRLLIFGDLGPRKCADSIIQAFAQVANECTELLLAGKWRLNNTHAAGILDGLVARGAAVLHDRYIAENEVSQYFCSADYCVCVYPSWFRVSSNTFTRSCAVGVPVIGARHGKVGSDLSKYGCGITCEPNVDGIAKAMVQAFALVGSEKYQHMSEQAVLLAEARTTSHYSRQLFEGYRCVLKSK